MTFSLCIASYSLFLKSKLSIINLTPNNNKLTLNIVDLTKNLIVKLKNKCWDKNTEPAQDNSMLIYWA